MPDISSLPWWQAPPFYSDAEERRYRRRSHHNDYQRPGSFYMITISASRLLPPLSTVQRDQTGRAVTLLTPFGQCFFLALKEWCEQHQTEIRLHCFVIMPDHVHFCISTIWHLKSKFSTIIAGLMGKATKQLRSLLEANPSLHRQVIDTALTRLKRHDPAKWAHVLHDHADVIPIDGIKYFSRGFTDSIAYDDRRWKNQKLYVADNPRRLLFKRENPDYLLRRWSVTIPEYTLTATGNILLLKKPNLVVVRYSSKYSPAEQARRRREWEECIYSGGVLVSPFIHPIERAAMKQAIAEGAFIIRVCENGFPEKFSPSKEDFELLSQGRLLLITDRPYTPERKAMTKDVAMSLNKIAATIVSHPWLDPGQTPAPLPL